MIALAFGFAWLGWSYGLYGYCLLKGYDVRLSDLMNPVHVYQWPQGGPPIMPPNQVFPTGRKSGGGGGSPPTLA